MTESAAAIEQVTRETAENSNKGLGLCRSFLGSKIPFRKGNGLHFQEWTALKAGGSRVKGNCSCYSILDGLPVSLGLVWPGEDLSLHDGYSNINV